MRATLERIIEEAGEVEVNAASVVSAVSAYARINSRGEWVERAETVNLTEIFQRMTSSELKGDAKTGNLPDWFNAPTGATPRARLLRQLLRECREHCRSITTLCQ